MEEFLLRISEIFWPVFPKQIKMRNNYSLSAVIWWSMRWNFIAFVKEKWNNKILKSEECSPDLPYRFRGCPGRFCWQYISVTSLSECIYSWTSLLLLGALLLYSIVLCRSAWGTWLHLLVFASFEVDLSVFIFHHLHLPRNATID